MNLKNKDPFGGVHREPKSFAPSPFKIDKDGTQRNSKILIKFTDSWKY